MWKCPQLVCHDLLMLSTVPKWRPLRWNLSYGKRKKSHGLRSDEYGSCGTIGISFFFCKKFIHGGGSVTGSVVVMQHPSVRSLWPDMMNRFTDPFKDLTIVLFINCLSLRHEFLMKNTLTFEKKNKLAWIWFSICSFLLSSGLVICWCATPNFDVWFWDRTRKSTIYHLLWHVWKKYFVIFDAFKKVQAHIPSIFLLFFSEDFRNQLCTNLPHAQFLSQNVVDGLLIQIHPLPIILTGKCRSDLTRALALVIFSSVFDVQGLPERGLFSTFSRPSKNTLYHLKTGAFDRVRSP